MKGAISGSAHPYIPNSAPAAQELLLQSVGLRDIAELHAMVPPELRIPRPLQLPPPLQSEQELRRHVLEFLDQNLSCEDHLSFLGSGCWQHFVPAVCDEIASRAEFLTAYTGRTYADLGKFQAVFEYQSMLGELLGMDVVSAPTYDWMTAATSAAAEPFSSLRR
jgi:glycine dehydrogenase subunit 1